MRPGISLLGGATALAVMLAPSTTWASSHREAPYITKMPKVDGTDLYAFSSYEAGRKGYVTILANYYPLQDPAGGPNFFMLDPDAIYEIHIDNNGDAKEDITFRFDFHNVLVNGTGIQLDVGPAGNTKKTAVPFITVAPVSATKNAGQNVFEHYKLSVISGSRHGTSKAVEACSGGETFSKPLDNIGTKAIPNYDAYARSFIYEVDVPGCNAPNGTKARVFVGQRQEGFAVNVGGIFDLLHFDTGGDAGVANILGGQYQGFNDLTPKSVTTLALEVPAACLTKAGQPIIGLWTTSSVRQARVINPKPTFGKPTREGGPWAQISRLANPLINEVIIGLKDKDRFNSSEPRDDGQFADYVTHPSLPEIVELLLGGAGVVAPNRFPRTDLVATFLTGFPGVNANGSTAEMMRLNTAIPATPMASQNPYGAALCFDAPTATSDAKLNVMRAGCDPAGFPNGRRPGDDVTDIELRVAMGYLLNTTDAPSGQLPFVDGAGVNADAFSASFPYLTTPRPGSPQMPKPGDLPRGAVH
ncbi:MAG: DUF4331 domain-containing protein [Myxococcota bacterium]|nr:DUF4331 domain-containing protein [Deltaproteobacteria bacterium]MDQ3336051.1 DUF4331 domain-containing protein [Myxococcota bacterium]